MYYETEPKSLTLFESGTRWKLGAIFDNNAGATNMSFVNGICTYNGGTHVKYITDQICDGIIEIIKKKNGKLIFSSGESVFSSVDLITKEFSEIDSNTIKMKYLLIIICLFIVIKYQFIIGIFIFLIYMETQKNNEF